MTGKSAKSGEDLGKSTDLAAIRAVVERFLAAPGFSKELADAQLAMNRLIGVSPLEWLAALVRVIDATMARTSAPLVCATVEDVVRAAPVAGFYPVMPSPDWSRPAAPEWQVMRLTVRPAASAVPARRWWVLDDEGWIPEDQFIGWRIGARIRMPGEAG